MSVCHDRLESFVRGLPKAELHVHVEGTLEPEMLVAFARRNRVAIRHRSVEQLRAAYRFPDLRSFLDLYYDGTRVLVTERDFRELTVAYLDRARRDGVRYVELFFDPQAHTERGIALETVLAGLGAAIDDVRRRGGPETALILCFLRDRGPAAAMRTLEQALPYRDRLLGVGLDSIELGFPPAPFRAVFDRARRSGLRLVAHAGEEGPPEYVRDALDVLGAERIDHGVRALEDASLVQRLARERIPLTVCPLSNVRLRVFPSIERHNLGQLIEAGVMVTLHSDDPAYFGGYVADNYLAAARGLGLRREQLARLAADSFRCAFLPEAQQRDFIAQVGRYAGVAV